VKCNKLGENFVQVVKKWRQLIKENFIFEEGN
jgi:hypothetical protein